MFHVLFVEHSYDDNSYTDLPFIHDEIADTGFSTLTAAKWYADSITEFPEVSKDCVGNYWTADVYWCPDDEDVLIPHHLAAIPATYSHTEFYEGNLVSDVYDDDYFPEETIMEFNKHLVAV